MKLDENTVLEYTRTRTPEEIDALGARLAAMLIRMQDMQDTPLNPNNPVVVPLTVGELMSVVDAIALKSANTGMRLEVGMDDKGGVKVDLVEDTK